MDDREDWIEAHMGDTPDLDRLALLPAAVVVLVGIVAIVLILAL